MNEVLIGEHFLYVDGHSVSLECIEEWAETEYPLREMSEEKRIIVLLSRAILYYQDQVKMLKQRMEEREDD